MNSHLGRVDDRVNRQESRPRVRQRSQRAGSGRVGGGRRVVAIERGRRVTAAPPLAGTAMGSDRRRVRRRVEHQVADVDRADAVDHAVVRLGRECPTTVGEPLDERHLPQRPMAIQALGEEARCPLRQLLIASGGGECRAGDVPANVKRGIVLPFGPRQPAGVRLRQALSVARQLPQPARRCRHSSSRDGEPPSGRGSKTMITPVCMCALSSACSSSRNVASRAVRCSLAVTMCCPPCRCLVALHVAV